MKSNEKKPDNKKESKQEPFKPNKNFKEIFGEKLEKRHHKS